MSARRDIAHRGYLIRTSPMSDAVWIERDGVTIARDVRTVEHAKRVIDSLLDGARAAATCQEEEEGAR